MPNFAGSLHDLQSFVTARVPVVGLRSIEQSRALRVIKSVAAAPKRTAYPFTVYTRATGLRDLRTNSPVSEDRSLVGAMEMAADQFAARPSSTMVFVEPDDLRDDNAVTRHFAELARLADANSGSIILVTDSPIWSGLARLGMTISLDLPDSGEMYTTIVDFLRDHNGTVPIAWTDGDARRASEMLAGVTEGEAINMLATLVAKGSVDREDVTLLARSKDRIFGDLTGLERIQLKESDYDVGGLANLREWLGRKQQLIMADLRGTNLRPPRGVLLVGVPGCGKSLSAKAIAAEWQLPLYRLDLASVLGQYVGQSESRLREALETADRVAPCVLWIDEIEKGLAGQNDSTGVGRRLMGQFLFWLQESTSRSFVVATANDVRSLPPELVRKGRFDELFFVDLPTEEERREIITLYIRKYVKSDVPEALLTELVEISEGFSGADIESSLHEVGAEMYRTQSSALDADFVRASFVNTVPIGRAHPEELEDIRAWGRERAIPAGLAHRPSPQDATTSGRRIILMKE